MLFGRLLLALATTAAATTPPPGVYELDADGREAVIVVADGRVWGVATWSDESPRSLETTAFDAKAVRLRATDDGLEAIEEPGEEARARFAGSYVLMGEPVTELAGEYERSGAPLQEATLRLRAEKDGRMNAMAIVTSRASAVDDAPRASLWEGTAEKVNTLTVFTDGERRLEVCRQGDTLWVLDAGGELTFAGRYHRVGDAK